jgi:ferrochelatase
MARMPAFDAVLVIAFGGPQGPADVRPFLANVLRGRRVSPERVEAVAHHYDLFGGVSPLTALTRRQADGLQARLRERDLPLPVRVGMRNWHPLLEDTLADMSQRGERRAIGVIAAAHRSYSSCAQYRENVASARAALAGRGLADVEVYYVGDWHTHPGFIDANAARVHEARLQLPADVRDEARVVFTAHSIPVSMALQYPYQQQIEESARLVMARLAELKFGLTEASDRLAELKFGPTEASDRLAELKFGPTEASSTVVYQSRSGRPEDPWLGPDICDYLREEAASGLRAVVIAPVGFICDHIEVLYDLDVEAAGVCRELGLPVARAQTVNDHPRFLDALADAVIDTHRRYDGARPLQVIAAP